MKPVALRLALLLVILGSLWLFIVRPWWFPAGAVARAATLDRAFYISFLLLGILFLAGQFALIWVIGRVRSDASSPQNWPGNWKLEVALTLPIPAIFFLVNFSRCKFGSDMTPPSPPAHAVRV